MYLVQVNGIAPTNGSRYSFIMPLLLGQRELLTALSCIQHWLNERTVVATCINYTGDLFKAILNMYHMPL